MPTAQLRVPSGLIQPVLLRDAEPARQSDSVDRISLFSSLRVIQTVALLDNFVVQLRPVTNNISKQLKMSSKIRLY